MIARFQADFEEAARAPLPVDAASLMPLAEQVRAGAMSENDFDGQLSSYLDALPRDEYGQPVIGSQDLTFVRKASSVASGVQLLESLSEQRLALEATKGVKQAIVAERRGHLNRLLNYLGNDSRPAGLTQARAVRFVEESLNPWPVGKSRKQFALATCRSFADWMEVRGVIPPSNPFGRVGILLRAPDTKREERATWSPESLAHAPSDPGGEPHVGLGSPRCAYGCPASGAVQRALPGRERDHVDHQYEQDRSRRAHDSHPAPAQSTCVHAGGSKLGWLALTRIDCVRAGPESLHPDRQALADSAQANRIAKDARRLQLASHRNHLDDGGRVSRMAPAADCWPRGRLNDHGEA